MEKMDLSIGIELADKFSAPMKKAVNVGDKFQQKMAENQVILRKIGSERTSIRKYQDLGSAALKSSEKITNAFMRRRKAHDAINKKRLAGEKVTKKMVLAYDSATKSLKRLRTQHKTQESGLTALRQKLQGAGIDTRNLANEQKRLGDRYAQVAKQSRAMARETEKSRQVQRRFDKQLQRAANVSLVAGGMRSVGQSALNLLRAPTNAMRAVERGKGDLQALGVQDTDVIIKQGRELQRAYANINTASFVRAAYDIRSGIDGLSDAGVAAVTAEAAITAKATKSTTEGMTDLFGTGFGIFKKAQYADKTNQEFAEIFGATITGAVSTFKTTGAKMKQAIESMGAGLTISGVGMHEQIVTLAMLQGTMMSSVSGTTMSALERSSARANERFADSGRSVEILNEDGNMKGLADLLQALQDEFGETFTTEIGFEIQEAFGSEEGVKIFKTLWGQQDRLRKETEYSIERAKAGGEYTRTTAANVDRDNADSRLALATQRLQIAQQKLGTAMVPFYEMVLPVAEAIGRWVEDTVENGGLLPKLFLGIVGGLGVLATGLAPVVTGLASLAITAAWLKKSMVQLGISQRQQSLAGAMGGGPGDGFFGKRRKGLGKLLGGLKKWGGKIGWLGAGLSALSIGSTLTDNTLSGGEKAKAVTKDVGVIGGAAGGGWAGAAIGGAIGTMIFPGAGTAVGAVVGGLIGGWLGSEGGAALGETVSNWFSDDETSAEGGKFTEKAKTVVAGMGVAGVITAGSIGAAAEEPILSPVAKPAVHITDQSQNTFSITIAPTAGMDAEEFGRVAGDAVEARMREIKREQQEEQGAALYDTDE